MSVNAGDVADTNGTVTAAGQMGTFEIAITDDVSAMSAVRSSRAVNDRRNIHTGCRDQLVLRRDGSFTFNVDWNGDGTVDQKVYGPSGSTVDHTFASAGDFTIHVVATDAYSAAGRQAQRTSR